MLFTYFIKNTEPVQESQSKIVFKLLNKLYSVSMHQQTLKSIYRSVDPEHYYQQYHVDKKIRQDGRSFLQHRLVRGSLNNNTVLLRRGSTIVVASVSFQAKDVAYNALTDAYDSKIITFSVQMRDSGKSNQRLQRSLEAQLEALIEPKLFERQLISRDSSEVHQSANLARICLKVLSSDGSLAPTVLLAAQLLLWTLKNPLTGKTLELKRFHVGFTYSCTVGQVLADPTLEEEQDAQMLLTIYKNIINADSHFVSTKLSRMSDTTCIDQLIGKTAKAHFGELKVDLQRLKQAAVQGEGCDFVISVN